MGPGFHSQKQGGSYGDGDAAALKSEARVQDAVSPVVHPSRGPDLVPDLVLECIETNIQSVNFSNACHS